MDVIRAIKLKHLNGDLDNLKEIEKSFLSFFNDLIKDGDLYIKDNDIYFEYDLKHNEFWCSYDKVWSHLESKYNMNYVEICNFIKKLLEEHLNINDVSPKMWLNPTINDLK